MKTTKILTTLFLLSCSFVHASNYTLEENSYASLLLSDNFDMIEVASNHIHRDQNKNTEMLDLVAEVLWINFQKVGEELGKHSNAKKLSKLIRNLEESEYSRYRTILQNVKKKTDNNIIRDDSEDAIDGLSKKEMPQFIPGTISLENYRDNITKLTRGISSQRSIAKFLLIKRGSNLLSVYERLGFPDKLSIGNGLGRGQKRIYLQAEYFPFGTLLFNVGKVRKNKHTGPVLKYVKTSFADIDSEKMITNLRELLFGDNFVDIRTAARYMYHSKMDSVVVLDIIAERVLASIGKNSDADAYVDSIAWLCEVIRMSGNSRYRDAMLYLNKHSKIRKLRSYADDALDELTDVDVPQFNLDANNKG